MINLINTFDFGHPGIIINKTDLEAVWHGYWHISVPASNIDYLLHLNYLQHVIQDMIEEGSNNG